MTSTASPFVIEVRNLRKSYGQLVAVDGLDLQVRRNEVFAMLGPNGAGKTTTTEILEGHRDRDSGDVTVLGFDPGKHEMALRERIGVVLQQTGVIPYISVAETLAQYATYYPKPMSVDHVLDLIGLTEQRDMRVKKLSGGQQRRLDVGVGLIGDPDLLFLDEPTTGFDPEARRGAWEMVQSLQSLGKTVFLTTHYMDEAQQLADRLAIVQRGKIVAEGTPNQLINRDVNTLVRFRKSPQTEQLVTGLEGRASTDADSIAFSTPTPTALLYELTRRAAELGIELPELTVSRSSLEDAYLRLVTEAEAEVPA